MTDQTPNCARCPFSTADRLCRTDSGKSPAACPTRNRDDLVARSLEEYRQKEEICAFAKQAAIQEAECYQHREQGYERVRCSKTRIEEIIEFAGKMGYRRIGLAFCLGLAREAKVVEQIFAGRGLEMVSAICKVGRVPKKELGLRRDQQIDTGGEETMCNPILQAMVLNDGKTDLNVLLGLCVGHDSLFFKYAEAPCTVLAVKDRLLGHNPLAAIYTSDSYYRSLK